MPPTVMAASPYPNPVTGDLVHFPISLSTADRVQLSVFTLAGDLVFSREWWLRAGTYVGPARACFWDLSEGERRGGQRIGNGILLYRLSGESFSQRGRIAVMRPAETDR